ncbi:MAG: LCP family protein [Thermoanaerobacterales bacterium]|nr:LytR family transcriptional regulator [Thermoanaerobacterales bacterium]
MRGARQGRHRRRRRSWGQRLALIGGCLSSLGLVASAAGLAYLFRKYERLPRVELSGVLDEPVGSGEPENYLIVGIDSAADLPPDDSVRIGRGPTLRSDTIMILRTDPGSGRAALLSIPRDLYVRHADGRQARINLAIERGGAPLLIETIGENFAIPIHHYVQVDFASFRGLVEAVGGVTVPFPYPARDEQTGLLVTEPGCHTLDPVEALAYVRSRFYEQLIDGEWVTDVRSDIGRIERQQDFIRRALRRAIDRGARNPATLDQLIDVALDGIVVDDELTADDIFDLARRFRSFDPDDLVTYALEGTPDTVGEAQVLRLVEGPETEAILSIFRGSSSAEIEPEGVRLVVHNGTGAPRQGAEAAEALRAVGFIASVAGDEPGAGAEGTVVRYPPAQAAAADLVARWLAGGARLEVDETLDGIELVTGTDWQGVRTEPLPTTTTSTTLPAPTTTTSTTTTTEAGGAPPTGARTTTTVDLATLEC